MPGAGLVGIPAQNLQAGLTCRDGVALRQLAARRLQGDGALGCLDHTSRSNRLVDGLREAGEQFRARVGHVPAILQAYAELAGNVDPGLVGEAHARLERRRVAMHEIGRLVTVETDAMAGTMRQAGELVAWSPALALVVLAHGVVQHAGGNADLRGLEGDLLPAPHGVPDLALARVRFAEYPGPRDIRLIPMHGAAAVHEDHGPLGARLRLAGAVRIGGRLVQQSQGEFRRASQGSGGAV